MLEEETADEEEIVGLGEPLSFEEELETLEELFFEDELKAEEELFLLEEEKETVGFLDMVVVISKALQPQSERISKKIKI